MRFTKTAAATLAASLPIAFAQTSTDCNPTEKSCPADTGLDSTSYTADFTQGSGANASWSAAAYTTINYGSQGAEFTIAKAGQAPTIQTDFYFLFGRVDVKMQASPGQGIVSSIVFESDDLDEIDWEFLGGDSSEVETNYFSKGNTTTYNRATYVKVSSQEVHTYSIDWTSERLQWIIDGSVVRTLNYDDPITEGGKFYPQTPMRAKLGSWSGGGPGEPEGTVEWAGGKCDYSKGPFTMYVDSVSITNANPASSYEYGDLSGSYESIKIIKDGQTENMNGTAAASGATSTAKVTGSASASGGAIGASGNATATAAPTSSLTVAGVQGQTKAAVSTTITGSSYSTNTASASAENSKGTMATSVVSATTEVPGSSPSGSSGSSNSSGSGNSTSSSTPTAQTNAASTANFMVASSLLSVVLGFMFL